MDEQLIHQIFDELLASLEPLETQNSALLQFLKAKGIATDEELAPFLEQAGNTANIRWRAVRVRTNALLNSALKPAEQSTEGGSAARPSASNKPSAQSGGQSSADEPQKSEDETHKKEDTHQQTDPKAEGHGKESKDEINEDKKEQQKKDSIQKERTENADRVSNSEDKKETPTAKPTAPPAKIPKDGSKEKAA